MSRKKQPNEGKLRTREHIVADLAVHHVQGQVLRCGWTVEEVRRDYGIDLILFTYTEAGEMQSGIVFIQTKGTERLTWLQSGDVASHRIARNDLVAWLPLTTPVILAVYDVEEDRAYWVHVQTYFANQEAFNLFEAGDKVTIRLPRSQVLTPDAVRHFATLRDQTQTAAHPEDQP